MEKQQEELLRRIETELNSHPVAQGRLDSPVTCSIVELYELQDYLKQQIPKATLVELGRTAFGDSGEYKILYLVDTRANQ